MPTLHIATRKGLFTLRESPGRRDLSRPAFPGEAVTAVLAADGRLFAALRLGHFGVKLHRSDDDGATWRELAAPAFPAGLEEAPAVDMIWTLARDGAGTLYAGTLPAALFRSTDGGESWSLMESLWQVPERKDWQGGGYDLPGLHTVLVDPREPRRLTVAVSTGGVWRSADAGASWRLTGTGLHADYMPPALAKELVAQDVHRLAACAAAPETVWCQHHNGIFRSTDGGETFDRLDPVQPSAFGFAVAAHPRDAQTAWFVPAVKDECRIPVDARLVVTRTTDGGRTFEALGSGLPAADCYDLVYRHGLDVDAAGERLAMGSTTGTLWLGQDGGAHWEQLDAHLPPIAQVAFA